MVIQGSSKLQRVSELCSFFWLNNTRLCGRTTICLSTISWWKCELFPAPGPCEWCCCEHPCKVSVWMYVSVSLSIYLGVKWLDQMTGVILNFLGNCRTLFQSGREPFCIAPNDGREACLSLPCQHLLNCHHFISEGASEDTESNKIPHTLLTIIAQ